MFDHTAQGAARRGQPEIVSRSASAASGAAGRIVSGKQCPATPRFRSIVWAVVAAVLVVSSVAFGGPLPPSYIYGIDDTNQLWEMNMAGTSGTAIAQTPLSGTSNGLAYDSGRNDLFVVDGQNNLWWWNQGTTQYAQIATATALGITSSDQSQPWSAAYYDNAYWFFLGNGLLGTDQLRKVSLSYTGTAAPQPTVVSYDTYTALGITGSNAFGDIAIVESGPNAGTLYAYTYSDPGHFYSLDLNTIGTGTTVGGYSLINTTSGTGLQIAFNSDYSVLYGHNHDDGKWYTIDTSSGALSPVLAGSGTFTTITGDGKGFRDIGGSAVEAVPEPSTLVLAAMGAGIVAWRLTRRRKRRSGVAQSTAAACCLLAVSCCFTGGEVMAAQHEGAGDGTGAAMVRAAMIGQGSAACSLRFGRLEVTSGQYAAFLSAVHAAGDGTVADAACELRDAGTARSGAIGSATAVVSPFGSEAQDLVGCGLVRPRIDTTSPSMTRQEDFLTGRNTWADLEGRPDPASYYGSFDRGGDGIPGVGSLHGSRSPLGFDSESLGGLETEPYDRAAFVLRTAGL